METSIPILNNFLYYLMAVRNYSPKTIHDYSQDLQNFFKFIIEYQELNVKPKDLTVFILGTVKESTILQYLIYLHQYRNNCPKSRSKILGAIKCFYKWLFLKYPGTLQNKKNPTSEIPSINSMERLPKYVKLKDAQRLQSIFNKNNSRFYIRNNAIITLFLNAGLRASELINIDISDVDFNAKRVRIVGKGNKERVVLLTQKSINAINKYLKTRTDKEEPLFINAKKQRFKVRGIEEVCEKAYDLAGLKDKKYTTHTLRHTSATYLYKSCKDILIVKEFLGHNSLASTQIYTHILSEMAKDAVNKNPLNKISNRKLSKK